jgi:2,3-bisphosphoglycerate-dependent phosphoglycerate mutase
MKKYYIYLFRHGKTYFNESKRFTGWLNSGLTLEGLKNSKVVAKKLKNKEIHVAFQTKLSRSKDSLKEVLKFHPECKKIITDNRVIERSYGDLEGKYHKTVISEFGKRQFDVWHRSYDTPPSNGESIKMVEKRVNSFIKYLIKYIEKNKVNVVISAHGNSMRPFRRYFEKLTVEKMMTLENPYNDYFEYVVKVK